MSVLGQMYACYKCVISSIMVRDNEDEGKNEGLQGNHLVPRALLSIAIFKAYYQDERTIFLER